MTYRKILWNKGWLGEMYWLAPVDSDNLEHPSSQRPEGNKAGVGLIIMDDYIESPIGELFSQYLDISYIWQKKYSNGEKFNVWGKNYYSYKNVYAMAKAMRRIADLIEDDYDNSLLREYKNFSLFSLLPKDDPDFEDRYTENIVLEERLLRKHAPVMIRLYRNLAEALITVMEIKSNCDTICLGYHPDAYGGTVSEEYAETNGLQWN